MSAKSEPKPPINICIVEDHFEYCTILSDAMASNERLHCQDTFSNVEDILDYFEDGNPAPDIIILDLGLPGMDGIEAIPLLRSAAPNAQILVLTVFVNKARVFQALGAGASGYLNKTDELAITIQGIEDAYHGLAPLSAEIAQMVFSTFSHFKPASTEEQLSEREISVLDQLKTGASRQEAADALNISIHTISSHIRSIYKKLQVHNVSGALNKADSMGFI